ncbi:ABC transporter substrate-binding protein [Paenibacillus sp. GCM10012303]|jgi:multiple sugar transport system substrate-binding protein|uniref:ABC transporter substrate-binding protein n=1 Tax=Paenibacillus sp. GCM10012303 TaxID=3317340 RepID=UPI003620F4CD
MKKKGIRRRSIVAPLMLALVLSACGGGQQAAAPEGSAPQGSAPQEGTQLKVPSEPVPITVYSNNKMTEEAFNKQYGDAIRSKFPNVKLTFTSDVLKDTIAAKVPIDIMFGSIGTFFTHLYDFELQYDLSELAKSRGYSFDKLEPTMVDLQRKLGGGKLYGLPVWTATSGLFYNKDLFDKFGQPYPKDGMTWEELASLSKAMTRVEGGIQYYGYVTSPGAQMSTNQLGLDPVDPKTMKANLTSEPWKQFMQNIVDLYKAAGLTYTKDELDIAKSRNFFEKESRAAMYTNFTGGTPPETMNWDVVQVPSLPNAPGVGPQPYPNYWYVASISKQKETAFDIIAFLTSEQFQIPHNRAGYATVLKDPEIKKQYGQDMPKFQGKNVSAMFPKKSSAPMNYTPFANDAQVEFQNAFLSHMLGEKDLNTALRDAAEQLDKKIREKTQ